MDCLSTLLRRIEDIHQLGQLLGISEDTLAAIESYYDDNTFKTKHIILEVLIKDHDDLVSKLRDALNVLGKEEISQILYLLTSLG